MEGIRTPMQVYRFVAGNCDRALFLYSYCMLMMNRHGQMCKMCACTCFYTACTEFYKSPVKRGNNDLINISFVSHKVNDVFFAFIYVF